MPTATADALVGRRLEGRYRILDRIARGGMSTVYAAVDERLDRLVAVKVMNAALSNDPAFSDRFAREARAAARLAHVNVVSVYDQGHDAASDGHHVFLVMELVEGRTVRELLRERGRLTPAEAVSIMEPVLSALAAAHRAGLVHRDVKPENILLSDDGVVKVVDFGLARAVEADAASTRTGLMMGTVAYCAPEQLTDGQSDPRSDVYSAGIVLYELLTGEPPYRGETAMNVAYQHVHSRVPAPSSKVRGVPAEIDALVRAATDTEPSGRPSDAGDFVAAVADARGVLGLPVTPVPARPRGSRPAARGRTQAAGPASSRTGVIDRGFQPSETTDRLRARVTAHAHDTAVVPQRGAARPADPPPPVVIPPAKRRHPRRRAAIVLALIVLLGIGAFFGTRAFIAWQFAHVPDVSSLSRYDAERKLEAAGYDVKVNPGTENDPQVPVGHVLRTNPDAGSRLATGKTVTITLSAGPRYFTIPPIAPNTSRAAAQQKLKDAGLTVDDTPRVEYSDTVATGAVTRTVPAAGQRVTATQKVAIVQSQGPRPVAIPTIPDGTSYKDAKALLRKAGFKVVRAPDDEYSDAVADGDVISISPSTPTAPHLSTITVLVSKGPQYVDIPDIAPNTSATDAEAAIRNAGLVPALQVVTGSAPYLVFAVRPDRLRGKVLVGSTVTLYVIGS